MKMFDEMYAALYEAEGAPGEYVTHLEAQALDARFGNLINGVRMLRGEGLDLSFDTPTPADAPTGMGSMMSTPAFARSELSVIRSNVDRLKAAITA